MNQLRRCLLEFAVIDGVNLPSLQQTLKFRLEISVQFWRLGNFESTHLMVGTVSYLCSSTHVAGDEWVRAVRIDWDQQGVVWSMRLVCGQRHTTASVEPIDLPNRSMDSSAFR